MHRRDLALSAAEHLAPRIGRTLPEAVLRALDDGGPPRSAIEGIAAHVVRIVDAVLGGARDVEALRAAVPAVYGASPAIGRAVVDEVLSLTVAEAA